MSLLIENLNIKFQVHISVSGNEIYMNSTFMGPSAEYQIENTQIDLRGDNIDKYVLYKEKYTLTECIELTKDLLQYQNSKNKEISRSLTAAEYKQLRAELERMELVEPIYTPPYGKKDDQARLLLSFSTYDSQTLFLN